MSRATGNTRFCLIILFLLSSTTLLLAQGYKSRGVPAYPYPLTASQPDGEKITLIMKGDRVLHWYETPAGKKVLQNSQGYFVYAEKDADNLLIPGKKIVRKDDGLVLKSASNNISSTEKTVFFSKAQIDDKNVRYYTNASSTPKLSHPTSGNCKLLVILVDFPDQTALLTPNVLNNVMNQENYDGTGSFRDYYLEASYRKLDITTTVTQWVRASKNMSYYGEDDSYGWDLHIPELVREVIDSMEARGTDFSEYDNDHDGYLDAIQVIHAGYGTESGAPASSIWSHSYVLDDYRVSYDGVIIDDYSIYPELRSNTGSDPVQIGVICHEFGHNLGLDDYYDVDDVGSGGWAFDLNDWDLMSSGMWNNDGATPAGHNAYSKHIIGWLNLTELINPTPIELRNSDEFPEAYFYSTSTSDEFFVFENRQQVGFDTYIPGHGLLVYHVDKNYSGWSNNTINVDPAHQAFDLEEADNILSAATRDGDAFPGTANITEFTDFTLPGSRSWANQTSDKPITKIEETAGIISFDFLKTGVLDPEYYLVMPLDTGVIKVSWQLNVFSDSVMVAWSKDSIKGVPVDGNNYSIGDILPGGGTVIYKGNDNDFIQDTLIANTTYYYKIWSVSESMYSEGIIKNATTLCGIETLPYEELFSSQVLPECWTLLDREGSGQNWRFDNPGSKNIKTTTAAGGFAILDSDYYGQFESQNADLISPVFDFSIDTSYRLHFEHHYLHQLYTSKATLSVTTNDGLAWIEVDQWESTTSNPEIYDKDITPYVKGESKVRFKWNYRGTYAYHWAVDDVRFYIQVPDSGIEITSFELAEKTSDAVINSNTHEITAKVYYGTDITKLIPVIGLSRNATVNPGSGKETDFSSPVVYTVTAENGKTQEWLVTVTIAPNHENYITSFELSEQANPAIIDYFNKTVNIDVKKSTDRSALTPEITISEKATISPLSGTTQDFTSPQVYTVTAENGNTQKWVVNVSIVQSSENNILSFSIEGEAKESIIYTDTKTIKAFILTHASKTSLTPTFTISDYASVSPPSGVSQDFSYDFIYTVTAENGNAQEWLVKVIIGTEIISPCPVNLIKIFPNPTSGSIFIDLNDVDQIQVISCYSIIGEKIMEYSVDNEQFITIDLQSEPEGTYFLYFTSQKFHAVKRIVLKK